MMKVAPGYEMLNSAEKDFCERKNILPTEYLELKIKIIREQCKCLGISDKLIIEKLT
jgi:hypothetical protein